MLAEKKRLSFEDIEVQAVLELPNRATPVVVIIGCLAVCVGQIRLRVEDVNVAAQVCAQVDVINTTLGQEVLTCTISQR
jgi:hypothetical protein